MRILTLCSIAFFLSLATIGCEHEDTQAAVKLENEKKELAANLAMYETVWDEIINGRKLDQINSTYFEDDIIMIMKPKNVVGIEAFKAYYKNYLTGFSDIKFSIKEIFGQGGNIVKHWNFKGKHTGTFFGIPATGKLVDIDGATLVKIKRGKIAQEQDFMDNLEFMQQLGVVKK